MFLKIVKINNFRGDLTDISAKKEALIQAVSSKTQHWFVQVEDSVPRWKDAVWDDLTADALMTNKGMKISPHDAQAACEEVISWMKHVDTVVSTRQKEVHAGVAGVESAVIQSARASNRCGVLQICRFSDFKIKYRGVANHSTTFPRVVGWLQGVNCL